MIKKFAFTLAEVLITLAIIGVVAVITIPTMVAGNREKAWNTAATVFEKRLNETLKVMNVEGKLEGYTSTKDFVNALSSQLKITKTCDNSNLTSCFSDKVYWGGGDATPEEVDISKVKMAKNFGQKDWGTEVVGFQLNNGTNGLIAYNPDCEVDKFDTNADATSCVAVLYDTTGFAQPNTSGKDLRGINVLSLGGKDCAFEISGLCWGAPFSIKPLSYSECEAQKSNLGITWCYSDDYWAGAVKACNDQGKRLPSEDELKALADDIYGVDIYGGNTYVSGGVYFYGNWNESKVNSYELGTTSFILWSSHEGPGLSYGREFSSNSTQRYDYSRQQSDILAVCVK